MIDGSILFKNAINRIRILVKSETINQRNIGIDRYSDGKISWRTRQDKQGKVGSNFQ